MSVAPAFLSLSVASQGEKDRIEQGLARISFFSEANRTAAKFYEGTPVVEQFGISIPPSMQNVRVAAGWGGVVVDVLEERLDWEGWSSDGDDFGLRDIYTANTLDVDSGTAHLDALIHGVSFVSVGTGQDGEPSPLITPHSPETMTAIWDRRTRRVQWAVAAYQVDEHRTEVTLYGPDETVRFASDRGTWAVDMRDRHNLGRVPVVMVPNRVRGSRQTGRSEITAPVRYYTEAAIRTLLGLEVNREFYNAPQRIGLNIPQDAFTDESGNPVSQWTAIMGRVWNVPPNGDGEAEPKMMQFNGASPAPYLDQVRGYALNVSAESGIPADYFGIQTANPSSADAIRAGEARLVKRAERRQTIFGRAWREVGRLALLVRDGDVPDTYDDVRLKWRDAATPTRAAAADEAAKLVGAGILPPDSSVTLDRIGLDLGEQRQLQADRRRAQGRRTLDALIGLGSQASQEPEEQGAGPVAE